MRLFSFQIFLNSASTVAAVSPAKPLTLVTLRFCTSSTKPFDVVTCLPMVNIYMEIISQMMLRKFSIFKYSKGTSGLSSYFLIAPFVQLLYCFTWLKITSYFLTYQLFLEHSMLYLAMKWHPLSSRMRCWRHTV